MKISLVIPLHNEEENISSLIQKIRGDLRLNYELVLVDDHSTDNTSRILQGLARDYQNIKVVKNSDNQGFANALKEGFNNATAEAVIPVMGDLCDDLSTVEKMLEKINEGYDVVCGSRYMPGGARLGGSRLKGFFSSLGGRSIHLLLGIPTHDIANAFKMYRKVVLDTIKTEALGFEISMEIPLKAYFLGFKITEVPTVWRERTKGKSSFKVFKLLPRYLKLYFWAVLKKSRS